MLIAHVSDLHIGQDGDTDHAAERIAAKLAASGAGVVVASGDLTHRGRLAELARFEALFRPLLDTGRMVVVPGNHDRLGDDAAGAIMAGARVRTWRRGGLHVIRIDSTAPHNRWWLNAHGRLTAEDLEAVEGALREAPTGATVAAVLHHHVSPLPGDVFAERLAGLVGLPFTSELAAGARLLELLRGRCDLVLHGHRHRSSEVILDPSSPRPLRILNAGSTPMLGRFRTLAPRAPGRWVERWLDVTDSPAPLAPWGAVGGRAAA